jgi:hypothetical protein
MRSLGRTIPRYELPAPKSGSGDNPRQSSNPHDRPLSSTGLYFMAPGAKRSQEAPVRQRCLAQLRASPAPVSRNF